MKHPVRAGRRPTRGAYVYDAPRYYEIAFSFFDAARQVRLLKGFISAFSRRKVRRILDVCCGPSLQLREFLRQGYFGIGLDASLRMLAYLKERLGGRARLFRAVRADMCRFRIRPKADFAMIMMGSVGMADNARYRSHLAAVAGSLNRGGLYLIENAPLWTGDRRCIEQSWTMRREKVRVRSRYSSTPIDPLGQLVHDRIVLDVSDGGKKVRLQDGRETKLLSPQELVTLARWDGHFDFVGFFERGRVEPLRGPRPDNIVLLRRR